MTNKNHPLTWQIDNFGPNPCTLRPFLPHPDGARDGPSGRNNGQPPLDIQDSTTKGLGWDQGIVPTIMGKSQKRPEIRSVESVKIRKIEDFGPISTSAGTSFAKPHCPTSTTNHMPPPSHIVGKVSMNTSSTVGHRSDHGFSNAQTSKTHQPLPGEIDDSGPDLPLQGEITTHTPSNSPQPTGMDLILESLGNIQFELMRFEEIMECEDVPIRMWMNELQRRMPTTHRGALNELRNEPSPIDIDSYHEFKERIIEFATRNEVRDTEYARMAITNSEIHYAIQQASLEGSSLCSFSASSSPSEDNTIRTTPSPRTPTHIDIPPGSMLLNGEVPTSPSPIRHLDPSTIDTPMPNQYDYNRTSLHILNKERWGRERNMPSRQRPPCNGQRGHRRV